MFTKSSLIKVCHLMSVAKEFYMKLQARDIKMCISMGNTKIGRVMNVSLPPILTCANCSECRKYCYDVKACLQYPETVIDARIRNLVILLKDRDGYFDRIREKLARRRKNLFFRWHVAGDIIDIDYFDRMVKLAKEFPAFVFWTYTKNYKVVNEWIRQHGGKEAIPSNLHIMFSEWRGMEMVNPYDMPEFRVVFKDDQVKPTGFYCPGNCDICKELKRGCLAGETTYCNEH